MSKYTFLAVRKPDELKGVYSGEKNIKKINEKIQGLKGASSRVFKENQEKEALQWAGTKGLADVPQIAISKKIKKTDNKNKIEEKPDVQIIIEQYIKNKYATATIFLNTGENIRIQIRDIYYWDNTGYPGIRSSNNENANNLFYSSRFNPKIQKNEYFYDKERFNKLKDKIKKLNATNTTYLKNGLALKNYGLYIDQFNVSLENKEIYIPYASISYIKPTGFWAHLGTKITDEEIIRDCHEYIS